MFAAHFAAGLAIGARERRAPMTALLVGAFLPDLVWIVLAALGVEPASPGAFFDGWSHSFLSILIQATLFSLCFLGRERRACVSVWLAVMSHVILDDIIHPAPIQLFPHSKLHVPWDLWHWGQVAVTPAFTHYWWIQFAIVILLLATYAKLAVKAFLPNLVTATVLLVLRLHLLF